jgi:hypothetical protein
MSSKSVIKIGLGQSKDLFIQNYGNYSQNFSTVNPIGEQDNSFTFWFFIISLILIFIFYFLKLGISKDKDEDSNKNSLLDNALLILSFMAIGSCGFSIIYLIIHWIAYEMQYFEWYLSLPEEAQMAHEAIKNNNIFKIKSVY